MKKLFLIAFLFPVMAYSQNCEVVASIGGHTGTDSASVKETASWSALNVLNKCKDNKSYAIISYDFSCASADGKKLVTFPCKGPSFTDEVKIAVREAKSGAKFYFDMVMVKDPDGKTKPIPGMTIHVK